MDSDNILINQLVNPCCRSLKERYSKLEEKRKALREGLKLLNGVVDKLQRENLTLKKAYEEEKVQADAEREEKSKESAARVSLEGEIDVLKDEKEVLESRVQDFDRNMLLLRRQLSEREAEIEKLKELVERGREEKFKESSNRVFLEKEIVVLKSKIDSLLEREGSNSNAQAVNCEISLLSTRNSEMGEEINKLKKLVEEEREKKDKELGNRVLLEREIDVLKSEIHSFRERESSKANDQPVECGKPVVATCHDEMETEIINKLKELVEEEKLEKNKELANRVLLEKENAALKTEIHSLHERENSKSNAQVIDSEFSLLVTRADMEAEISKLKEVIEREKAEKKMELANRVSLAKENVEMEAEISKLKEVIEREKAEKKKELANRVSLAKENVEMEKEISKLKEVIEREKAEKKKELANRVSLAKENDVLKAEVQSLHAQESSKSKDEDSELLLLRTQIAEMETEFDNLKMLFENERIKSDCERKSKMKEEQKKVDENQAMLKKLKRKVGEVRSQLVIERDAKKKMELERQKALDEKRLVDAEIAKVEFYKKKASDEKCRGDNLSRQLEENKQKILSLQKQMQENVKRLKEEKQKIIRKKKNTDPVSNKSEISKDVAEVNEKKDLEEKIDKLQKEISILLFSKSSLEVSVANSDKDINSKNAELEMMRKHLKLKNKQVKHAKEVAKLERDRKDMLQQKLDSMNYEFVHFLQRIKVLDDCFVHNTEGRNRSNKDNIYNSSLSNLQEELLSKYPNQLQIPQDNVAEKSNSLAISGIDSKMDSMLRCSEREKLESCAINSTMASFTDTPLMVSQGKDSLVTTTARLLEGNTFLQSNIHNIAENSGQSPMKKSRKRKSIVNAVQSIENLYSQGKNWQMRLEGKLSEIHGMLQNPTGNSFQEKSNKKRKKGSSVEQVEHLFEGSKNPKEKNGICDIDRDNRELGCFKEMVEGDFMKLLDLDNDVDEECYRRALERPLSPFVPVMEFQISNIKEIVRRDVIDNRNCESEAVRRQESDIVMGSSEYAANLSCQSDKLPKYCVVFSDNEDLSSISRIYCAVKCCLDQCSVTFEIQALFDRLHEACLLAQLYSNKLEFRGWGKSWVVQLETSSFSRPENKKSPTFKLINQMQPNFKNKNKKGCLKLKANKSLVTLTELEHVQVAVTKERASVVFSVLLNFSETTAKDWNSWPTYFIQLSDSLARCLQKVISDAKTRSLLVELCFSGELIKLIEDFLLNRRFLASTDMFSESLSLSDFRVNILLNEKQVLLYSTLASRFQLLHGTIILTSICVATDQIGFLCEASHNLFRLSKIENSLVRDILHIFAYVCGPKYFAIEDYILTMTVVRSLVAFLERESDKRGYACCLSSSMKVFDKCPFSEDAVSMDVVTSLLLEKLQKYVSDADNTSPIDTYESYPMSCSENCCLNKFETATGESAYIYDQKVCHFRDIISLVELVATNMHWDWTCEHIVPQMLKLLDLCPHGNFFTSIVVFLGKLGRLGVDASGYNNKGVESLRSRISALLNQNFAKELAFPAQIIIINALVGIIPINSEKLIKSHADIPSSYREFAINIRNWYSILSIEQQSLSLRFFEQPVSQVKELFSAQVKV